VILPWTIVSTHALDALQYAALRHFHRAWRQVPQRTLRDLAIIAALVEAGNEVIGGLIGEPLI
jgi:hypothetical protein